MAEGLNERIHRLKGIDPKKVCYQPCCRGYFVHNYILEAKGTLRALIECRAEIVDGEEGGWINIRIEDAVSEFDWTLESFSEAVWEAWCWWKEKGK